MSSAFYGLLGVSATAKNPTELVGDAKDSKGPKNEPLKSPMGASAGALVGPLEPYVLIAPSHRVRGLMGSMKGKKQQVIKTTVCQQLVVASSANTALTTVTSLTPIGQQDWSSFAAVFDLARVERVKFHVSMNTSGSALSGSATWGLAFDPANSGVYSSVADVMTAAFKLAPLAIFNATATFPDFTSSKTGFLTFNGKLEQQKVTNDGGATALVGGGWFGTSDTTSIIGYLKPYVPSLGTGVVSNLVVYIEYFCEFKWRT